MSYMRGKYYIWSDDRDIHFWIDDEDEVMAESDWAEQRGVDRVMGAVMPEAIFDELVVMRYAEICEEGKLFKTEDRAYKKWQGNFGCEALARRLGKSTPFSQILKDSDVKKKTRA